MSHPLARGPSRPAGSLPPSPGSPGLAPQPLTDQRHRNNKAMNGGEMKNLETRSATKTLDSKHLHGGIPREGRRGQASSLPYGQQASGRVLVLQPAGSARNHKLGAAPPRPRPTHPARSCIRRRSPTRLPPAWHHPVAPPRPDPCSITTRTRVANQYAHHFVGVQGVPSHRTSLPKGQANHPGSLRARRGPRRVAVPAS